MKRTYAAALLLAAALTGTAAAGPWAAAPLPGGAGTAISRAQVQTLMDQYIQPGALTPLASWVELDSTLLLPPAAEGAGVAHAVGTVTDCETKLPVAGAVVTILSLEGGDAVSVSTDAAGRFQVLGLPSGFYTWSLSGDGYCGAAYCGYSVCEGITTLFTFRLSRQTAIEKVSYQYDQYIETILQAR